MKIELKGETPSKKNSRINTRIGRSFPNQKYMKWHDMIVSELHFLIMRKQLVPFRHDARVSLSVTFVHGDYKRRDSDNQLSSILDTFVDAGILPDDNWKVIPEKHVYDRYEKDTPHCVIEMNEIEDEV